MAEFLFWASTIATIIAAFVATMIQFVISWMQQRSFSSDMADNRLQIAIMNETQEALKKEIEKLNEKVSNISMNAFEAAQNSKDILKTLKNGEVKSKNEGHEKS